MAARAGLIGIHTVAAPLAVAPLGGAKAALGTNPIAFGFPLEGDPLVFDLGTSAFMGTDLPFRQRLGIMLPEGVTIDEHSRPTTDVGPRDAARSCGSAGTRETRWRWRCTRSAESRDSVRRFISEKKRRHAHERAL